MSVLLLTYVSSRQQTFDSSVANGIDCNNDGDNSTCEVGSANVCQAGNTGYDCRCLAGYTYNCGAWRCDSYNPSKCGGGTTTPTDPGTTTPPSNGGGGKGATCPQGGQSGIKKTVCESTYCGSSYNAVFYNDNNKDGIACCRCDPKPVTAPVATPAVTNYGTSCAGAYSASSCKDKKVGDFVSDVCQCLRTKDNNCACVGLANRGEGVACSSDTNCISGLTCVGGRCSSKLGEIGGTCKFDNDCQTNLKCEGGQCRPKKVTTVTAQLTCGDKAFSPETEYCILGTPVPKNPSVTTAIKALLGGATVADSQNLGGGDMNYDMKNNGYRIGCAYYSRTQKSIVFERVNSAGNKVRYNSANTFPGLCCTGYTGGNIPECASNPNYETADIPALAQVDPTIANTPVGDSCKFVQIGCGISSASYILNKSGQAVTLATDIKGLYDLQAACSKGGTTFEENLHALNTFGLPTGPVTYAGDTGPDSTFYKDATNALSHKAQVYVRSDVQCNGHSYHHFAVVAGLDPATGKLLIWDPYLDSHLQVKKAGTLDELIEYGDDLPCTYNINSYALVSVQKLNSVVLFGN